MEAKSNNGWTIPENLQGKATLEQLKYIYERASKRLGDTKRSDERVTGRTTILLGFIITILTGISGHTFNLIANHSTDCRQIVVSIFCVIYLYIIIIYLKTNLKSQKTFNEGTAPKKLFIEYFIKDDKKDEENLKNFYEGELTNMQWSIDANNKTNGVKWDKFDYSLYAIIFMPIIAGIIYLITLA